MYNEDTIFNNTNDTSAKTLPIILLVEDNIDNKNLTTIFLMKICNVEHAATGELALEMIKNKSYKLIFMDINLGDGMDGWETAKHIRMKEEYKSIPIIALSGYTLDMTFEELQNRGITNHLTKPFNKKTICELVQEILQSNPLF